MVMCSWLLRASAADGMRWKMLTELKGVSLILLEMGYWETIVCVWAIPAIFSILAISMARSKNIGKGNVTPRIPGPTRLADPNRVRGARPYTGNLYLIFFQNRTCNCGYGPHLITKSKYHIHFSSPINKYKTVLLHLQIRARNLR